MIEYVTAPEFIAAMTDADLSDAYQRTTGKGAQADALLAEIERRGLDV